MKILFINLYRQDYMTNLLLHGLISLGHEVIDLNYMDYLDKCNESKIDRNLLYGHGFSYAFTIDKDRSNDDRSNIEEKIAEHYFDIIFLSTRNLQYLDLIAEKYKLGEIFIIDGEDEPIINNDIIFKYNNILYFKRELLNGNAVGHTYSHLYPINFCIPKENFQSKNYYKESLCIYDDYKPNQIYELFKPRNYSYTNEQEYYNHYKNAAFALTGRKGGYDCMRHYEIISNHCLPLYIDWDKVPRSCMTLWPNLLQLEANTLYIDYYIFSRYNNEQFNNRYFKLLDEFYDYAYNNLTTEALAKYLLKFC